MMFFVFTLRLTFFMIVTGFALYSEGSGRDSWQYKVFGWVFSFFPNSQDVHTFHHLGMWGWSASSSCISTPRCAKTSCRARP